MAAKTLIPPIAIGETLAGKYRIERILGAGAMGIVLQATHVELDQKVAIKFLLRSAGEDSEMFVRFGREARTLAKLESEHVIRVIDVGALGDGTPYMVMEYLEGRDLAAILRERGAIPVRETVAWLLDACDAVADAHAAGVIHRDLKPANLFLVKRKTGRALLKVLDFGISKTLGKEELALTRTTAILGSPLYMAPEQLRESRSVDERTDVWALGVIAYELVTAVVPFNANTLTGLVTKIVEETPEPPHARRPDIPDALSKTIERCLAKEPSARWPSVTALAGELRAVLDALPIVSAGEESKSTNRESDAAPPRAISSFAQSVDAPSTNPPPDADDSIGISTTTRGVEILSARPAVGQPAGEGEDEERETPSAVAEKRSRVGGGARWQLPLVVGVVAIGITALAVWGAADDSTTTTSKQAPSGVATPTIPPSLSSSAAQPVVLVEPSAIPSTSASALAPLTLTTAAHAKPRPTSSASSSSSQPRPPPPPSASSMTAPTTTPTTPQVAPPSSRGLL